MTPREKYALRVLLGMIATGTLLGWALRDIAHGTVPEADTDLAPVVFVPATTTTAATAVVVAPAQATTTAPTTTQPATTTIPAGDWACPGVVALAVVVGWTTTELDTLDRVVYRESRCISSVTNLKDRDRSYGYTQINVKGTLWADRQTLCELRIPEDLLDGETNLRCALRLWERSGWSPWGE